jgi:hypothetical protein
MSIKLEHLLENYFAEKAFQQASGRTPDCLPFSVLADAPCKGLQPAQMEHARSCPACRRSLILSLRSLCPSEEQLGLYQAGKSSIAEAITAHLEMQACPQCSKVAVPLTFAAGSQTRAGSRSPSREPGRWLGSFGAWRFVLTAACLLVAILVGMFAFTPTRRGIARLVHRGRPSGPPSPSGAGTPLLADPVVVARALPTGKVEVESPSLPANLRDAIRQMLEGRPVDQPASVLVALDQTRVALRGEELRHGIQSRGSMQANPVSSPVISPSGVLIGTLHPSFRWSGVAQAQGFRITLVDTAYRAHPLNFPRSDGTGYLPATDDTMFTLPGNTSLRPGHTYEWELVAKTNGTPIYFPPAFFTILDPKSLDTVRQIETKFSASPLVLAALYQSYGCFDDAAAQLDKLSSPDRKLTDAMRANLRAQREAATRIQR